MYVKWLLRFSVVGGVLACAYIALVVYVHSNQEKLLPGGYRVITHSQSRGIWSVDAYHESHAERGQALSGLVKKITVKGAIVMGYVDDTEPTEFDPFPNAGWFILDTESNEIAYSMTRTQLNTRLQAMDIDANRIDFVSPRELDDAEFKR